jgi:iron(III) transport system permease protein
MRRAAVALALLLVLLAGTIPAAAGFARGFRTDEVTLASGERILGSVLERGDTVQVVSGSGPREFPRAEVREVRRGAAWTGTHAARALADPFLAQVLGWTLAIALLGTLGAVLLGVPFALWTARTDLPGRRLLGALYAAPLVLPPLLTAMAWDSVLPRPWVSGPSGLGRAGTAFQAAGLFALAYFPLVTLFTRRSLAAAGASAEEAATLAAGPARALVRVTLPLARPGIVLGALFAFVFCLNDFSVVDYLNLARTADRQVSVYPFVLQFQFMRQVGGVEELLVAGIPTALLSLGALAAALGMAVRPGSGSVGASWRPPRPFPLGPGARVAGWAFCGAVLAAGCLVPVISLLAEAGGPSAYALVFRSGTAGGSLRLTLALGAAAVLLAVPAAVVLAEAARGAGRGAPILVGFLAAVPLAVVPALVPLGAMEVWNRPLLTFDRDGPWNPVYDTPILSALVIVSRVLPFALAAVWSSLRETAPSLHEAGEAAGIPWDLRLRGVVLPLARPGVVLGALLAFVFAARELDALAVLASDTLLHRLWGALHYQRDATVAAMAVVLLALLATAFGIAAATGGLRPRGAYAGGAPAASASRSRAAS